MRRLVAGIAMIFFLIAAAPASAAGQGFQPPNAKIHNHTLTDIAAAWVLWAFGSPEDENPLLASRCEQSPIDPNIWFLPSSLGGDMEIDCQIPRGAFLVLTPAGYGCTGADGVGTTEAELRACVEPGFDEFTNIEASLDGKAVKDVERYIVTTPVVQLPGPNLVSDDATPSVLRGVFLVVHPLSPGAAHRARPRRSRRRLHGGDHVSPDGPVGAASAAHPLSTSRGRAPPATTWRVDAPLHRHVPCEAPVRAPTVPRTQGGAGTGVPPARRRRGRQLGGLGQWRDRSC